MPIFRPDQTTSTLISTAGQEPEKQLKGAFFAVALDQNEQICYTDIFDVRALVYSAPLQKTLIFPIIAIVFPL